MENTKKRRIVPRIVGSDAHFVIFAACFVQSFSIDLEADDKNRRLLVHMLIKQF